ncbi:MAG TPA: tetratricopeptide repeat protein [Gemmatimonadaceae bacterium]
MSNLAKLKKNAAEFEQKRQFERALAAYEEVLKEQDGSEELDVSLFNRVGDLHLRQGRTSEALQAYERAADLYIERGFHNNAIALCNKILRQDPRRADVHYKLGRVSAMKGFRTDARQHFLEYATLMQAVGRLDEAFAALQEFADLAPEHDDLRLLLADQLARHGRVEQAVEQLLLALQLYESEQRHAEAQQVRERIHELDPAFIEHSDDHAGASRASGESPAPRRPVTPPGGSRTPGMPELVLIEPTGFSGRRSQAVPGVSASPTAATDAVAASAADGSSSEPELEAGESPLNRHSRPVEMPEGLIRGAELELDGGPRLEVDDASAPFTPADVQLTGMVDGLDAPLGGSTGGTVDVADVGPMLGFMPTVELDGASPDDAADGEDDDMLVELPFIDDSAATARGGDQAGEPVALDFVLPAEPAAHSGEWSVDDVATDGTAAGDRGGADAAGDDMPPNGAELAESLVVRRPAVRPVRPVRPATTTPGSGRSVMPTPLATRPVPETPVGTRPVRDAAGDAQGGDWINLGDLLRGDDGPRSTRLVVEERAPSGDEQADFSAMLRKFKQGVAENVDDADYDSHYDLGVAYKEMGLVDDAIAQFQRALRGPHLRARAYEALGQCFVDRGQHAVATTVLQRALAEPGLDDQQLVGVLYLLGRANEAMDNRSEALHYYQRVLAVDITFSDVAERMGMVEQVPR